MQTYNLDGNYPMGGNLTTGYYQKAYRIEDLSWEKSTTWGIGLDAVINHVTFTFDYYDRKTTDIIMEYRSRLSLAWILISITWVLCVTEVSRYS